MEGYCSCGSSSGGLDISRVWLFATPRTPGPSVPHHLPKFAQVHVHCISDAIQPSHPLTSSSPSALNLFQHQGLFQWVNGSHQMTKILKFQLQHPVSIQGWFPLRLTGLISLLAEGFSEVFCRPQFEFFSAPCSLWPSSHNCTCPLGRP